MSSLCGCGSGIQRLFAAGAASARCREQPACNGTVYTLIDSASGARGNDLPAESQRQDCCNASHTSAASHCEDSSGGAARTALGDGDAGLVYSHDQHSEAESRKGAAWCEHSDAEIAAINAMLCDMEERLWHDR